MGKPFPQPVDPCYTSVGHAPLDRVDRMASWGYLFVPRSEAAVDEEDAAAEQVGEGS